MRRRPPPGDKKTRQLRHSVPASLISYWNSFFFDLIEYCQSKNFQLWNTDFRQKNQALKQHMMPDDISDCGAKNGDASSGNLPNQIYKDAISASDAIKSNTQGNFNSST